MPDPRSRMPGCVRGYAKFFRYAAGGEHTRKDRCGLDRRPIECQRQRQLKDKKDGTESKQEATTNKGDNEPLM